MSNQHHFEKNLELLEKRQPELAALMRDEIDTSHIEVLTSEAGVPTARVTTPEGKKILLHDLKDPIAKAKEHVEKLQLIGNNGSVLLGFGLGYLALEMVNSMEEGHLLIICETDPALFKSALEQVDLEPVLKSTQVKILIGNEIDISANMVSLAIKYLTSKISVVKFQPSFSIDPHTYNSLEKKAWEKAVYIQVNANTILHGGKYIAGNILANTPDIIRSSGVKRLFGKFKDIPAIVVGAGPSLDKNVTLLREIQDKAVIVTVDRALGLLLPLGITPHLVPSLDFSKPNYDEKYAPLQIDEELFLVFTQTLYHKITKTFWGPKFAMNHLGNLSHILSYYCEDKGTVASGLHVGHLAFCLAEAIGCNPIIMVGMDLAFTGNKVHAEDIETQLPMYTSERFTSEGIFGDILKSDSAFTSFVIDLNHEIKRSGALCIDATEGGARKEGTKIMRLRDAIDEYCQQEHPEIKKILEDESFKPDQVKLDEMMRDLKLAEQESKKMRRTSESILKIVKRLRKMKDDGQEGSSEYVKLTHKAEKMTIRAGGRGPIMRMLENYNFLNTLFMGKDETKRIDEIENEFVKLDRQLDRAETYYKNFIKGLTPFIQDVQKLSKRLTVERNAHQTLENSSKKWNDYLKFGLDLMKAENYADAEAALKKVMELKPDYADAYYHLGNIYSEQNRFKTGIPVLQQSTALKSNFTKAKYLLNKCQERKQRWEERCKELREKFSKNNSQMRDQKESILEAGNFYFRVKDYERAEKEYLKVIDRYPTLPEAYYHLGHTYFALKDFEKGVEALSKALEFAPDNPSIYRDLGLVSIDRGLVEAAERFFLKATELKPDDIELKEMLGNIYLNNSLFEKAIKIYEDIVAIKPDHKEVAKTLSIAYQKLISENLRAGEVKA